MNRQRGRIALASLAIVLALTACGGDDKVSLDPPEITYGEDTSEMGMFVVDPRYTMAALVDDEWVLFDDIGELFRYRDLHPDTEFQAVWTHDFHSEDWVKAEDAWYVQSPGFTTPMGWLIGSFATEAEATAFQQKHGGVLMTWDEADDIAWTSPPAPDDPLFGATPVATPTGHDHHAPATPTP